MRGEDDGWVCVWLFEKLHTYLAELDPLGPRGLDDRQVQRIEFLSGTPPLRTAVRGSARSLVERLRPKHETYVDVDGES